MNSGVDLVIDQAALAANIDRAVEDRLAIGSREIKLATKGLERSLENATKGAVPGRMWAAWSSRFYPNEQANAAGIVFVSGGQRTKGAMTFWSQPGTARSKGGKFLAIPLPAAGSTGRRRSLTPLEWEARHNTDLEFVPRRGKAPLLVAQTGGAKRFGTFRRLSVKRLKGGERGSSWVPIFVLVPLIRFRNTLAIEPRVAQAEQELARALRGSA